MTSGTVLVTGASGYLAGHCIEELVAHGYSVRGTVRSLSGTSADHLERLAAQHGGTVALVQANLMSDDGWDDAVAGCDYIWHVASPAPVKVPRDEDELIRPAVDGTLRVLRAAARNGSVRRVVMTSSMDAVMQGHPRRAEPWTEQDWSNTDNCLPYPKSKTLAERAAWDFVAETALELVTINPGAVLGPVHVPVVNTSTEVVYQILGRKVPAVPRIGLAVVDVRDVAIAHRLAMEVPAAAGNRYLLAGEQIWMTDIADILAEELRPRGYRIPTVRMPNWAMWVIARVNPAARAALNYIGVMERVDDSRVRSELGWSSRPARDTVLATAQSLIDQGVIARSTRDYGTVSSR